MDPIIMTPTITFTTFTPEKLIKLPKTASMTIFHNIMGDKATLTSNIKERSLSPKSFFSI